MTEHKNRSRSLLPAILWSIPLLLVFAPILFGQEASTGQQIMQYVDDRDEGDDQVSLSIQRLINERGQERRRESIYIKRQYKGKNDFDTKLFILIQSPPRIKGTSFLNWSYEKEDKDDDQWLYLPALRKVRRISASDKEDAFMGTDFTYDDMGDRKVEEDTHTLLRSEVLEERDCYVVESVPVQKDYIYSKKITWVVKGEWIPLKVEYYDRKGKHLKTLTYSEWKRIDGIWSVGRMEMSNHQTGHRTILEIQKAKYNVDVPDDTFTTRTLQKGVRQSYFK